MVTIILRLVHALFFRWQGLLLLIPLCAAVSYQLVSAKHAPAATAGLIASDKKTQLYEAADPAVAKTLATLLPDQRKASALMLEALQQAGLLEQNIKLVVVRQRGQAFMQIDGEVLTEYSRWATLMDGLRKEVPFLQLARIHITQDEQYPARYLFGYRLLIPLKEGA